MTPLIRRAAIRLDLVARGQHGLAALEQIFRRIVHGARSSRSSIPLFATVAVLLGLAGVSAQDAATPNATLSGFHGVNQPSAYQGQFSDVVVAIDDYWNETFAAVGAFYASPGIVVVDRAMLTACGPVEPVPNAFYCPRDRTIYLVPQFLLDEQNRFGDYAPVAILAHEWGHHIQELVGVSGQSGKAHELQADCLMGAFTAYADDHGLLDYGDFLEALGAQQDAGDPIGFPEDNPQAHGEPEDRIKAMTKGYGGGPDIGCGLPLRSPVPPSAAPGTMTAAPVIPPAQPTVAMSASRPPLSLAELIPAALSLSPGQSFRLHDEGAATFDDVVANSPDPATAARQLREWGWSENYYRVFAADDPPRDAAGWVELSVDRFDSVDGAAQALVAYADARRASHHEQGVDLGLFSDQSEAMRGPAYNGNEVTIFARRGDLVMRATGITPRGDPTSDVIEAILKILMPLVDEPRVVPSAAFVSLPVEPDLPAGLRLTEEHARSASTIAQTFPDPARAEQLFQHWGWRENAARVFTGQTTAGTTRIEVSVFRLADPDMAAQALDFFLRGRAAGTKLTEVAPPDVGVSGMRAIAGPVAGEQEATVYFCRGASLFRVTAIGPGDPMRDLTDLLRSWR
jgi:predicted metalloprotease